MPEKPKNPPRKNTLRLNITPSRTVSGDSPEPLPKKSFVPPPAKVLRVEGGEKYRMGRVVAEGGMGMVQQVEDVHCQRVVAMKVIRRGRKITPDDTSRFMEEARITAQLEHPNIVPIHELGVDEDHNAYYTMKYVKGSTLTDILLTIRRGDERTIDQYQLSRLLNVFQKVCDAIAFAHSRSVVHCDLKPDNVMVCDYGEVVVMDWGLARKVQEADPGDHGPGRVIGTPGFLAPERMLRGSGIHPKADVYALGAMLYSILTLRPPLSGSDTVDVLRKVVRGEIAPPQAYNDPEELRRYATKDTSAKFPHCPEGRVPPALSEIAMKAMATNPDDRYSSVQEMQDEIAAFQNGLIWHPIADEDFSKSDFTQRWELFGGQWEIKDGELRMHSGEPQLLIFREDVPGDIRIEFDVHQESGYLNDLSCFL
ncbi:MAG TPA: serine/threonine-protein kinase, partial [Kiritimatiellia bacterium]